MAAFFPIRFGKSKSADIAQSLLALEAKLSFMSSRMDADLAELMQGNIVHEELWQNYQNFLKLSLPQKEDQLISLELELSLLKQYIACYCALDPTHTTVKWDVKMEGNAMLAPFILFPLLENALKRGYTKSIDTPIKIQLRSFGNNLVFSISNRVNHHIERQEQTEAIHWYKQRLLQVYGENQDLLFNSNSYTFKATLSIQGLLS